MFLPTHNLHLALLQPQIAPNTGNIARLCVATSTPLHIVRPMGFILSDKELRRSAMDYWPRLKLTLHDDNAAFFQSLADKPFWLFDSTGGLSIWDTDFHDAEHLIFGSETKGIPDDLLRAHPSRVVRIPQCKDERCLNLSTAAGIALYEALRRVQVDRGPAPPNMDRR
jgi:tRNA (cytidine/uridine-2'-O-)-methyltransferase